MELALSCQDPKPLLGHSLEANMDVGANEGGLVRLGQLLYLQSIFRKSVDFEEFRIRIDKRYDQKVFSLKKVAGRYLGNFWNVLLAIS